MMFIFLSVLLRMRNISNKILYGKSKDTFNVQ